MYQFVQARLFNLAYAAACVFALLVGFFAGIALIPEGLFRVDRIDVRTIETHFFHAQAVDKAQLSAGWMTPEDEGTWSRGARSILLIGVNDRRNTDLELEFVLFPYFANQLKKQTVRVTVNDHEVGIWKMKAPMRRTLRNVHVTKTVWTSRQPVKIDFEYANPKSPAELGIAGGGNERMAIKLSSLVVREQR